MIQNDGVTNLNLKQYLEKRCKENFVPLYVQWEITYGCNLRCTHCFIEDTTPGRFPELTTKEALRVVDQLADAGSLVLVFTGGEILLRKDFFEVATYARQKGFFLVMLTNATLIDEKVADKIAALDPMGLEISLLGANADTHDTITQSARSFDKTIKAIKLLRERDIFVKAKTPVMADNVDQYEELKEMIEDDLDSIPSFGNGILAKKNGCREVQMLDITEQELTELIQVKEGNVDLEEEQMAAHRRLLCKAGKSLCAINPVGDVQPCVIFPLKLGNLRKQSFDEIWDPYQNPTLRELRSLTIDDLNSCGTCGVQDHCVRCPGSALMETGDHTSCPTTSCSRATVKYDRFATATS